MVAREESACRHPGASPEFRRRAVELARLREKPIAQIAKDLGIAESGLRRWMAQADVDEGKREGPEQRRAQGARRAARPEAGPGDGSGDPQARERLLRKGAYFARENVLPK
jgi:transposase